MKKLVLTLSIIMFSMLGLSVNNAEAATKYSQVIFVVEKTNYSVDRVTYLFGVIDSIKAGKTLPKYNFVEVNGKKYKRTDYLFAVIDSIKAKKDIIDFLVKSTPVELSNVKSGKISNDFSKILDSNATDTTTKPEPKPTEPERFEVISIQ